MIAVTAWKTTVQAPLSLSVLKTRYKISEQLSEEKSIEMSEFNSLFAPVKTWKPTVRR